MIKYRLELLINGVPTLKNIEASPECEDLSLVMSIREKIWELDAFQIVRVVEISDKVLEGAWQIKASADELKMIACKEHKLELYVGYGMCVDCRWSEIHAMYGLYKHKELNNA
jgi:hypothetical protein